MPLTSPAGVVEKDVTLAGSEWRVWRTVALRAPGFPASLVLQLSGDAAAAAADRCQQTDADVEHWRRAALAELCPPAHADLAEVKRIRTIRRRLLKGIASADGSDAERALAAALRRRADAHAAFVAAYDADVASCEDRIREIVSDARFQEAVLWQNHRSLRSVLRRIREHHGAPWDRRHAYEFAAMHIQRYCVKNDTIGFFGPVGWARITDERAPIEVVPGRDLLARREVYFEGWCLDAVAAALNREPSMRRWCAPRRKAGVWIHRDRVYVPIVGAVSVTPADLCVLKLCDGARTATDVARACLAQSLSGFRSEADVFAALGRLVNRDLVSWQWEVASQQYPEKDLASRIERIEDPEASASAAGALGAVVAARDGVAAAAGQPAMLEARLDELDRTFTRVTVQPPTRRPGEMYAGRGLVFEDCRRDCEVRLGRELLDRLGPPLSIVLDGARWIALELARAVNAHLRRMHAELRLKTGNAAIDGHLFFEQILATAEQLPALSAPVARSYQERWHHILDIRDREWRCVRTVEEVSARATGVFDTAGRGWNRIVHFSPDVMIVARGLDAVRSGRYHCVLGELHATNTHTSSVFLTQHPDPDAMIAAIDEEIAHPGVVIQAPKGRWRGRTRDEAIPSTYWRYQYGDDIPNGPACRPLPAGSLEAVDSGAIVRMRARDASLEFDAIELFGEYLCPEAHRIIGQFLPTAAHMPRVTVGALTIVREQWHATASEVGVGERRAFAAEFLAVREWASRHGLPQFVFYKSPLERKPCYLDIRSPMYVRLCAKVMRRLEAHTPIRFAEMLPDIEDVWLIDSEGTRYTSELRFVARRPDRCDRR